MRNAAANGAWHALVETASAPYRARGRFAWHFARGKLHRDPVFRHLLARGLIAPRTRVLDVGCGQGLLASLVRAAGIAARQGCWPSGWAEAPLDAHVRGIEVLARDVERARGALGEDADVVCADMRTAAFANVDTVVILDVLHYVSVAEQDAVLARVRGALQGGGTLVLRIGDAAARRGFAASGWLDRIVTFARGQRVGPHAGRTLAAWTARLEELGFRVASEPMRSGTPFPNVLVVGTVAADVPMPMPLGCHAAAHA
ncbi:MAG: class I SAM-dependent methyltransferase [Caldimonas sp.]